LTDETGASAMASEIAKLKTDKLDVSAFNTFKDANTATLATKLDAATHEAYVTENDAEVAKKADKTWVESELAKKLDIETFNTFKSDNTNAISTAVKGEADAREAADKDIKAAAVTSISSSYDASNGELSINYAFIDPANATSFVLCESIEDSELEALFV
jgi:hypothetical protein